MVKEAERFAKDDKERREAIYIAPIGSTTRLPHLTKKFRRQSGCH
ncbi:unnamed protein product [Rhodiola kirilowii]